MHTTPVILAVTLLAAASLAGCMGQEQRALGGGAIPLVVGGDWATSDVNATGEAMALFAVEPGRENAEHFTLQLTSAAVNESSPSLKVTVWRGATVLAERELDLSPANATGAIVRETLVVEEPPGSGIEVGVEALEGHATVSLKAEAGAHPAEGAGAGGNASKR